MHYGVKLLVVALIVHVDVTFGDYQCFKCTGAAEDCTIDNGLATMEDCQVGEVCSIEIRCDGQGRLSWDKGCRRADNPGQGNAITLNTISCKQNNRQCSYFCDSPTCNERTPRSMVPKSVCGTLLDDKDAAAALIEDFHMSFNAEDPAAHIAAIDPDIIAHIPDRPESRGIRQEFIDRLPNAMNTYYRQDVVVEDAMILCDGDCAVGDGLYFVLSNFFKVLRETRDNGEPFKSMAVVKKEGDTFTLWRWALSKAA